MYFVLRGLKNRRYFQGFSERLGRLPRSFRQTGHTSIWLHAVSVGEVLAALPLLRILKERFPEAPLFLSVTTLAGRSAAAERAAALVDGVFFAPIDYACIVRLVLRTIRPRAVVVLETEIWPNLYRESKRAGCALLVVNGRISDSALPRYRRFRWFFRHVLALPDAILAQGRVSAARFAALGGPPERVIATGNLKYDFDPKSAEPPEAVARFLERARPAEIWISASTAAPVEPGDPDEDDLVISAFQQVAAAHPGLLLILAPRKPERFDRAASRLAAAGVPFVRRSALKGDEAPVLPSVLLLDSVGELGSLFPLAGVVFMGGTLARRGGHNILEPAASGRAIITGPHMENFAEIAEQFRAAGALLSIENAAELPGAVRRLLEHERDREQIGARARQMAERERGAAARAAAEIEKHYHAAIPTLLPATSPRILLGPLAQLWRLGSAAMRRINQARARRLSTPVISIGGITAGGAGKTPLVLWLADQLRQRGHSPAILTRGYRRQSAEPHVVLAAGEKAPPSRTGDEAQIYLRAAVAPVGIGADRAATGRLLEERFHPDVFLLDDGFQHTRLERDLDIVALDWMDPFGGGRLLPAGRLREPLTTLKRAGAVVITRIESGRSPAAIERMVRRWNPTAPVFTARMVARAWMDAATGIEAGPPAAVAAFCGLANPDSFWHSLRRLGVSPVFERQFPDHHRYTDREIAELAADARSAGAVALLTTEKDTANLPFGWVPASGGMTVLWLDARMEVDQAGALIAIAESASSSSSR